MRGRRLKPHSRFLEDPALKEFGLEDWGGKGKTDLIHPGQHPLVSFGEVGFQNVIAADGALVRREGGPIAFHFLRESCEVRFSRFVVATDGVDPDEYAAGGEDAVAIDEEVDLCARREVVD